MKLSPNKLHQMLHIAHPELYEAALSGDRLWLKLVDEGGKSIGDGVLLAVAELGHRPNELTLTLTPNPIWKVRRESRGIWVTVARKPRGKPIYVIHRFVNVVPGDTATFKVLGLTLSGS